MVVPHLEAHSDNHSHQDKDSKVPQGIKAIDIAPQDSKNFHLLTAQFDGLTAKPKLYHLHTADAGLSWSAPVQVDGNQPHAHAATRGMDPQIAASSTHLIAVWMTPGTDAYGGGPLATAISSDQGITWLPGPNPADDGSTDGHGFIDIAADSKGHFHLVWLDNRNGKRGLRYAKSIDNGKSWSANQTLDPETCECCWNTIAVDQNNLAILYRDKKPRDMKLLISRDLGQTWLPPKTIGTFDWDIEACPHVGGDLVIKDLLWHAVVWTAAESKTGVYYFRSDDAGSSWSQPKPMGDASSIHPSIAFNPQGQLLISTTGQNEQGRNIQTFLSQDLGRTWLKPQTISASDAQASHPLSFSIDGGFLIFWTETPQQQSAIWRSARIKP